MFMTTPVVIVLKVRERASDLHLFVFYVISLPTFWQVCRLHVVCQIVNLNRTSFFKYIFGKPYIVDIDGAETISWFPYFYRKVKNFLSIHVFLYFGRVISKDFLTLPYNFTLQKKSVTPSPL